MENQSMLEKVTNFIKYCGCISEFDKYFWLSKVPTLSEEFLTRIYTVLLEAERELLQVELQSVGRIKNLIDASYPELTEDYLPNYFEIFDEFKKIEENVTEANIQNFRKTLNKSIMASR